MFKARTCGNIRVYKAFFRLLIVENFIPPDIRDNLRERAYWDDDEDTWKLGKLNDVQQKNGTSEDVLVESAADSGVLASEASTSIISSPPYKNLLEKRPVGST